MTRNAAADPKKASRRRRRRLFVVAALLAELGAMKLRGYPLGGRIVVRCRKGHLFTTLWIPGASVKSLRFAWWRLQRCPVGHHWSVVTPVKEAELTRRERRQAHRQHDVPLP